MTEEQAMLEVLKKQQIATQVVLASYIVYDFRKYLYWYPSTGIYVIRVQYIKSIEDINCNSLEEAVDRWFKVSKAPRDNYEVR